jgi:hypothetical protein
MKTKQFVAQWGFCPHFDIPKIGLSDLCADCLSDPSQRSYHQSELLDLTHARQIAIFSWCPCEDNECSAVQTENPYLDCPTQ